MPELAGLVTVARMTETGRDVMARLAPLDTNISVLDDADFTRRFSETTRGVYYASSNRIYLRSSALELADLPARADNPARDRAVGTLIHEGMHRIQEADGVAGLGSALGRHHLPIQGLIGAVTGIVRARGTDESAVAAALRGMDRAQLDYEIEAFSVQRQFAREIVQERGGVVSPPATQQEIFDDIEHLYSRDISRNRRETADAVGELVARMYRQYRNAGG